MLRAMALGVRFVLELCLLASFAAFAAFLPFAILLKIILGFVFCGSTASVWGMFLSPKRKYEIGIIGHVLLEAVLFAAAALMLNSIGFPLLALTLVLIAAADRIALALLS